MYLIVHELNANPLYQMIETQDKVINVEAIRPHLLKYGNPAGSLYLEVQNEVGSVLATSESITIQSIHDEVVEDYFHGVVRFYVDASLAPNTKYRVQLKSTGYTFSESDYIGWCNGFDLKIVDNDFVAGFPIMDSLIMEIWERTKLKKGIA